MLFRQVLLAALLFVIFEVEVLFFLTWSVCVGEAGWIGFSGTAIFIAMLFVGLAY
ncbi:NADH-quinone oxidoreductase subunit A [Pseudomonas sp. CMR5c]|uniref:NADH-quinone oxidoreductase subunit A n=1 Tax=Pseudomonas sp. CMR5c TaxID=658630 RepID=UPI0013DE10F4